MKKKKITVDEGSVILHIRMPIKVYRILKEVADDTGYLVSEMARNIIRDAATKYKYLPSKINDYESNLKKAVEESERKTDELLKSIKAQKTTKSTGSEPKPANKISKGQGCGD